MRAAVLSLVTNETPRLLAPQLILRPSVVFVAGPIPVRARILCRRPWSRRGPELVAVPAPGDLLTYVPPPRESGRRHVIRQGPLSEVERAELRQIESENRAAGLMERPLTRADCKDGPRPCPFVSCRSHLWMDLTAAGNIIPNHPELEVWELEESCALDLAEQRGGMEAEDVGEILNVTDSSIHHHERHGLALIKEALGEENLHRIYLPVLGSTR